MALERALSAANRAGQWRSWKFLTLPIQIAAEQVASITSVAPKVAVQSSIAEEEAPSEWTVIKARIRERVPEIAFLNWFEGTRQLDRCGTALAVAVSDEATATYITNEYECVVHDAARSNGVAEVRFVVRGEAEGAGVGSCILAIWLSVVYE